jgi:peptidoglycan/xylan/chitin deacetylase (PgdA/CDA1 family)
MDASSLLKTGFDVLHYSGATSLLRPVFRGLGTIFCLHHVCPGGGRKTAFSPNYQLEITPEFLQETISLCQARGYDLVSLGEAVRRLGEGSSRPFAVFTLDDGYRDNAIHAAPVFRKNNCPYTIFVAPQIADGTCELWWRALELIIADASHFEADINGQKLSMPSRQDSQKLQVWKTVFPLVKAMPEYAQRKWISEVAARAGLDLGAYCRSVAMPWQEIAELSRDPLCTIGAHTMNHYAVAKLTDADALQEMSQSKTEIEKQLGEPVEYFAYPYGDHAAAGARDFRLAEEAGFKASVTTRKGVVFPEHAKHLQAIPRLMLSGRYQKQRYLDALLSGVPFALLNRFRKLDVT